MDGFIGEIRPFAFGFVPQGWLACNGQLLPVSQYAPLFSILGTTYGGNGTSNFQLPNLMGITPVGSGTTSSGASWPLGGQTGMEQVTLTASEIPPHNHTVTMEVVRSGFQTATTAAPAANSSWLTHPEQVVSDTVANLIPAFTATTAGNPDTTLHPLTVGVAGLGTPHENRQPYLAIQYCICNEGLFPTPS